MSKYVISKTLAPAPIEVAAPAEVDALPEGVIEHPTSEKLYAPLIKMEVRAPVPVPTDLRGTYLTCSKCGDYVTAGACGYCVSSGLVWNIVV